jgi:DNA-binding CsgD family transcriptional regulator
MEQQVLRHLAGGLSTSEIAARLGMKASTARNHISNLRRKFGATTRVGLAALAIEQGCLVSDDGPPE